MGGMHFLLSERIRVCYLYIIIHLDTDDVCRGTNFLFILVIYVLVSSSNLFNLLFDCWNINGLICGNRIIWMAFCSSLTLLIIVHAKFFFFFTPMQRNDV